MSTSTGAIISRIGLLFLLVFTLCHQLAFSAETETTDATGGGFFSEMEGAIKQFSAKANDELSSTMMNAAIEIAQTTKPFALSVGFGLALIYLFYEVLQFLGGRGQSLVPSLVDIGLPCIIGALFINNYSSIVVQFSEVLDSFRKIAGDNAISSIMGMYDSILTSVTTAIKHAYEEATADGVMKMLTRPGQQLLRIADLILTVVFVFIILALILVGIGELLGLLLMGPFLFAVGVAFGPIMISGIVTPWTREYFTKWVQFLVIAAALTGVINIVFTLAANVVESLKIVDYTGGEPTAVSLLIVAVLLLTVNSMISQAPSITSALFPGHVGVARSSNQGVTGAGKNAKALAGGTVKYPAAAIKGLFSGARAGVKSAKKTP